MVDVSLTPEQWCKSLLSNIFFIGISIGLDLAIIPCADLNSYYFHGIKLNLRRSIACIKKPCHSFTSFRCLRLSFCCYLYITGFSRNSRRGENSLLLLQYMIVNEENDRKQFASALLTKSWESKQTNFVIFSRLTACLE